MKRQSGQAFLGIGEVLVELRADFPDISVSKIRFLEAEGLISPARSPSGYRRFSGADVDKLRMILAAQRDHYLPLRVIRERLERGVPGHGLAEGDPASGGTAAAGRPPAGGQDRPAGRAEMVGRRELLEAAGIGEEQLAELEEHGLVRRSGRLYGQDALDVAATVAALAPYGVRARNLRTVVTSAERDVALIEQLVAPTLRQRDPRAREAAGRTARDIAALILRLRRALVESALAEAGLPGGELPDEGLPRDRRTVTGRPGAAGAGGASA